MQNKLTIPPGYQTVMPYLILKDAEAFIKFAIFVLEAKETKKIMRDAETIMHAEIMIGESTIMFAEATDIYKIQNAGLFVYVNDSDVAIEKSIVMGAKLISATSNQPYGRSGGILDPFGNTWWITTPLE
jgi:PhnB protein